MLDIFKPHPMSAYPNRNITPIDKNDFQEWIDRKYPFNSSIGTRYIASDEMTILEAEYRKEVLGEK